MHDIQFIRENPEKFDAAMKRRGLEPQSPAILAIDGKRRSVITQTQELQSKRNELSKSVGELMKAGKRDEAETVKAEVSGMKDRLAELEEAERQVNEELKTALAKLPAIMLDDVPDGEDDSENVEVSRWGEPTQFDFNPKDHVDLGENLGLMDFEAAAKLSGARFTVLKGPLAQLERALQQYCLNTTTTEFGYTEISSPILVKESAMFGTGQLPKFGEDAFCTAEGYWLIPTSEVSLTNLVGDMILDEADLPLRFTALTPCFRSEAGSAGKDTRGMIRTHQFWKAELVGITTPEQSEAEHERMVMIEETLFQRLGIPYQRVIQCSGDTGFASAKTYDINGWFPGQNCYRELTSCSNCWDFQARRMNARCRKAGEKNIRFVHTLNGSALSTSRFLVAIIENYQNADGSITVPEVLRPYMNGLEKITKA